MRRANLSYAPAACLWPVVDPLLHVGAGEADTGMVPLLRIDGSARGHIMRKRAWAVTVSALKRFNAFLLEIPLAFLKT